MKVNEEELIIFGFEVEIWLFEIYHDRVKQSFKNNTKRVKKRAMKSTLGFLPTLTKAINHDFLVKQQGNQLFDVTKQL